MSTIQLRSEAKPKINITIDADQLAEIDAVAVEQRSNRSAVIRQAIDVFLARKHEAKKAA